MKKHIKSLALVLAIAIAVGSLCWNYSLSKELESLRGSLSNNTQNLQSQIESIYVNVDNKLKEEASLLSKSDYEYGKIDIKNATADIVFSILPKEYTSNTAVEIIFDGKSWPLEFKGGCFTGTVTVPLFGDYYEVMDVKLTDGENIRTQTPEWSFSPIGLLGELSVTEGNLSSYGTYGDNTYKSTVEGVLQMDYYCKKDIGTLKELWLVQEINGEVKQRTQIPLNTTRPENLGVYSEYVGPETEYSSTSYYYEMKHTFEAPYGTTQAVYIEAVDSNGLHYRTAICQGMATALIEKESNSHGGDFYYSSKITDADGKILWEWK